MDTYRRLEGLPELAASILTIGTYDGLHRGHQAVIKELVSLAHDARVPAVVITFDSHPSQLLARNDQRPKERLTSPDRKAALFEALGVDVLLVLPFDLELSRMAAADFLEKVIVDRLHPSHIVVGYDHHFGHNRQGNADFLRSRAGLFHYDVHVVESVNSSGLTISSSNIRQLLREGRCAEAEDLLGRPYEIAGEVTRGDGRGIAIGYPTANLSPDEPAQLIPKRGVYVVSTEFGGILTFGMCNVGFRPTFGGTTQIIETHYFDPPETDLYRHRLAVRFHHRLRDERAFNDINELKNQLYQDKQKSLDWIKQHQGERSIHAIVS